MNNVSVVSVLKIAAEYDLERLHKEGKTVMVEGYECDPKYIMYLVEYITGVPYSKLKSTQKQN